MDTVITPTAAELAALMGVAPSGPPLSTEPVAPQESTTPAPTPRVVERAKEILAGVKEEPKGPQIPDDVKLKFLAHILNGVPFKQTAFVFDGEILIEFVGLTAAEDHFCKRIIAWEENQGLGVPEDRGERYATYRCALALARFEVHGFPQHTALCGIPARGDIPEFRASVQQWQQSLSESMDRILRGVHREFQATLAELVSQAGTPSFWQTPS